MGRCQSLAICALSPYSMDYTAKSCMSVVAALTLDDKAVVLGESHPQAGALENGQAAMETTLPLRALAASASIASMMSSVSSGVAPGHCDQPWRSRSWKASP